MNDFEEHIHTLTCKSCSFFFLLTVSVTDENDNNEHLFTLYNYTLLLLTSKQKKCIDNLISIIVINVKSN